MDGREVTSVYKLFNDNTISKIYIFSEKKFEIQNLSENYYTDEYRYIFI